MGGQALEERHYKKGEWIFQQGDEGDAFYVVQSGTATVLRAAAGGRERTLHNLKAWDVVSKIICEHVVHERPGRHQVVNHSPFRSGRNITYLSSILELSNVHG